MKKLISKALTLAMVVSTLAAPAKADTNSGTVLFEDDLNSASLISLSSGADANVPFQWYGKDGATIIDSNKALTSVGSNYTAAWEVPADLDVTQPYTLELTWAKKGGCEFMIYTKADDGAVNYERYLSAAGNNTYTVQIKFENGQIMRKRSVDSSYGNYSGASQKLWAVGLRQTANSNSYIDNIVLKQGDKTWTEDFEDKSISEFQNQALKLSDYFKPAAAFIETGAAGTGNKKLYLPAKSTNNGAWSYFKLPAITNGVYELSMDYQVGKAQNDYVYVIHESGNSETYQFPNKKDSDAGHISRLKLTIDKDNNKVTTSWIGADGTDKGSEFAITDATPVTSISFRTHNQATQNAWIDNVQFKRISGGEEFSPAAVGEQILAQADFEDYTKSKADYGFYTNGSSAYVGGKNGRGISAALTSGDFSYNERFMGYDFSNANNGETLGDGTYHVRFSYNSYDNASGNSIYFANADDNPNAYKEVILSTETLNSFANQWVDVDIEFEIPSRKWTAAVTPQTGDKYTTSGTFTNTNNQIPAITWWMKPSSNFKTTAAPAVDNFYVTKELANTDLDDSALILVANQEMIGTKDVPVSGVSAILDFGNDAVAASASKDNIKLLENGVEIDYNGYAEGTMWVIEPGELKYETTYAISVEKGIPDGNGAYINPRTFVFKTVRETVIPENNILGDVDFEDWTVDTLSSNYGTSDTTPGDGFTVWSTSGFVAGPDGTGQAAPMYMSAAAARSMQFWPVGEMRNATYYAEFDYKTGENYTVNKFYMDRGTPEQKDAQAQDIITTDEMKSFGSGWIKVSFKLINPSNVWSVKVTNAFGETVLEKTGSYPLANHVLTHLGWSFTRNNAATIEEAAAVDNFLMWLEYDSAPVLTKDSFKIYEGDVVQSASRISPDSDKLIVDFGQRIKASDIAAAADNVYIVDRATNSKIALEAADYSYNSGILEISLQNAGLELGKAYTLHVNALSNIASMQMEKAYDFNFTVAKDNLKVRFTGVTQNGVAAADGAKLTAGEAKVGIAFNNGTDTDTTLYVISANYEESGQLKSVSCTPVSAAADNQDKTEEITVTVEGSTTAFMIWDGFSTMNPLADTLKF